MPFIVCLVLSRSMPLIKSISSLGKHQLVYLSSSLIEVVDSLVHESLNILEVIRFTDLPIRFYSAGSSECFGDAGAAAADESTPF